MKNVKIMSIFLLLFSIAAFAISAVLFTTRENEKEKRILAEEQNAILLSKNETLMTKTAILKKDKEALNEEVQALTQAKERLDEEFNTAVQQRETALDRMSNLEMELEKANNKFKEYKLKTADIVGDFKKQNEKLLEKVNELEDRLSMGQIGVPQSGVLRTPVADSITGQKDEGDVELPKVVVKAEATGKTGKVIVVNKKYNFFISNLGKEHGIRLNDRVGVFRENKMIASAQVEKIYDNLSACGILNEKKGLAIREADVVKVMK